MKIIIKYALYCISLMVLFFILATYSVCKVVTESLDNDAKYYSGQGYRVSEHDVGNVTNISDVIELRDFSRFYVPYSVFQVYLISTSEKEYYVVGKARSIPLGVKAIVVDYVNPGGRNNDGEHVKEYSLLCYRTELTDHCFKVTTIDAMKTLLD